MKKEKEFGGGDRDWMYWGTKKGKIKQERTYIHRHGKI
jgi:hypothetical protein